MVKQMSLLKELLKNQNRNKTVKGEFISYWVEINYFLNFLVSSGKMSFQMNSSFNDIFVVKHINVILKCTLILNINETWNLNICIKYTKSIL